MRRFLALSFLMLFLVPFSLSAWDFSELRQQLKADLGQAGPQRPRLAVVYQTIKREELKQNYNLVLLKKELAHELVRSFTVADPLITAEILRKNQLTGERLLANAALTAQFAERAQAELVLLVALEPKGEALEVDAKLITTRNQPLGNHQMTLAPKRQKAQRLAQGPVAIQPRRAAAPAPTQTQEPKRQSRRLAQRESVFAQFDNLGMNTNDFMADHNDSWIEINPTAYINPMPNYLEVSAWANNLADTDIRLKRLRYDYTFPQMFQFGLQGYGNDDQAPHSAYASLKAQVVALEEFSVAVGYRARVLWNSENPEFSEDTELARFNDKRNKSTLFAALSRRDANLGLFMNAYIDNQRLGVGAKYLLTEDIKLVADAYQNYYEKPLLQSDAAAGVQVYNPMGTMFGLMYWLESEQVHATFGFNF